MPRQRKNYFSNKKAMPKKPSQRNPRAETAEDIKKKKPFRISDSGSVKVWKREDGQFYYEVSALNVPPSQRSFSAETMWVEKQEPFSLVAVNFASFGPHPQIVSGAVRVRFPLASVKKQVQEDEAFFQNLETEVDRDALEQIKKPDAQALLNMNHKNCATIDGTRWSAASQDRFCVFEVILIPPDLTHKIKNQAKYLAEVQSVLRVGLPLEMLYKIYVDLKNLSH